MSYLSVFVQYHASVRIARRVPPEAFEPAPNVSSAVVVVEPHEPAHDSVAAGAAAIAADEASEREAALWGLVQSGFRERRKMLRNVLARQLHAGADGVTGPLVGQQRVDAALAAVGIAGDRRPQTLSVEDWIRLRDALALLEAACEPEPGAGDPVIRLAPAKLNLTLAVTGRRRDGFHDLHSVMVPLALGDRLSLARAAAPADSLHVVGGADGRTPPRSRRLRLGPSRDRRGPAGRRRRLTRSRSRRDSRSSCRSPPASPAGAATPPPRSTARWRRGAPTSLRTRAATRRRPPARTCRSSWCVVPRSSRVAASA